MLARTLTRVLQQAHIHVLTPSKAEADLSNEPSLRNWTDLLNPGDFVINCAAYTKVDDCETNQDLALAVNGEGSGRIARLCLEKGLTLIHFSTDYVFDGESLDPYLETDLPSPLNQYGLSKLRGEEAIQAILSKHYIFRVQWLYGPHGQHFIRTISGLAKTKASLSIVNDQWGSPTSTTSVAQAVLAVIKNRPAYGLYHFHDDGFTTWYDYARFFLEQLSRRIELLPVTSEAFPRPAKRPKQSRLDMSKFLSLGIYTPPTWEQAVKTYLAEEIL